MQAVNISRHTLSALSRLSQRLSQGSLNHRPSSTARSTWKMIRLTTFIAGPWHKNSLLSLPLVPRRASPRPKARCPSLLSRGLSNWISKSPSTTSSTLQSISNALTSSASCSRAPSPPPSSTVNYRRPKRHRLKSALKLQLLVAGLSSISNLRHFTVRRLHSQLS